MGTELAWQPDWAVAPGEVLLEALEERGMTQVELARRIDRPLKTVNEIIKGKAAITPDTAIQLERALGISSSVWNGLEVNYREYLARQRDLLDLERDASWVDRFPVAELVRRGLLVKGRSKAETLAALLSFFKVSSPNAWRRNWNEPAASFRSSSAFIASPEAVATWLRWGEIEAEKISTEPFNADRLLAALQEIRSLTSKEPFAKVIDEVRRLCETAGVAVVLTPEFKGTRLSGAARWISSDKALLQLSLRHQSDDHFWFSFYHEAGHILQPGRKRDTLDPADDATSDDGANKDEEAANAFAREFLVPQHLYDLFVSAGSFDAVSVRDFSRKIGLATGIVVGRLQQDRHVPINHLNTLKKRLRWNG